MRFRSINDIYEIAPPLFFDGVNNRSLPEEEMFYLCVKGISITEQELLDREAALDAQTRRFEPAKAMDEQRRRTYEKVKEKVVSIHNYFIGDREVTDFDELVRDGQPELVRWLFTVLTSGEALSRAERKNFLSPSASPSSAV